MRLTAVLDDASWDGSTLRLGETEFELRGEDWSDWNRADGRFLLHKSPHILRAYARFWSKRPAPRNVLELGIWEGGSAVFWFEAFNPAKHVAIDEIERTDSAHFTSFVERRGVADRLKTYWGVDQADREALTEIVTREFDRPLDLVIDDASHIYGPTRVSFETLLPRLRPGGLYIIEDWQWSYQAEPPLGDAEPVARLVHETIDAVARRGAGVDAPPVKSVLAMPAFAVIERGVDL